MLRCVKLAFEITAFLIEGITDLVREVLKLTKQEHPAQGKVFKVCFYAFDDEHQQPTYKVEMRFDNQQKAEEFAVDLARKMKLVCKVFLPTPEGHQEIFSVDPSKT